jgi:hypothetical protein
MVLADDQPLAGLLNGRAFAQVGRFRVASYECLYN